MKFCPHCGENIAQYIAAETGRPATDSVAIQPTSGKYDAVATWKSLLEVADRRKVAPPTTEELVTSALEGIRPGHRKTIVHIAFDQDIVPRGGVLYRATLLEGRMPIDTDRLKKLGYAIDSEGHLVIQDDVPVGVLYQAIQYWGGSAQHKRWHMKYPVEVNPSRAGDLYFMDNNIVAFGVDWADTSQMEEAFKNLLDSMEGFKGSEPIGIPLALKLVEQ